MKPAILASERGGDEVDWFDLLPALVAIFAAIGIPVALRSLRKGGQSKVDEFHQHLRGIGVDATVLSKDGAQEGKGRKGTWAQKVVGSIRLADSKIDSVNVIGVASQYGVNYYLDYAVSRPAFASGGKKKKTTMTTKKSSRFKGEVIDVGWKGDDFLAQRLSLDFAVKQKLLQTDLSSLKGGISIHPEPKRDYARIRTGYILPEPQLFEALDMIANHVKSWY